MNSLENKQLLEALSIIKDVCKYNNCKTCPLCNETGCQLTKGHAPWEWDKIIERLEK